MAHLALTKILEGVSGIKRSGAAFVVDETVEATVFVALGMEVLQVPKVLKIEIANPDLLVFGNQKEERFYFPLEQIVGFKLAGEMKSPRLGAGFR